MKPIRPIYLGVDVAGTENTWVAALSATNTGLESIFPPKKDRLSNIVAYCEAHNVVAVAIDAPLTIALSEDNGFRTSDIELRNRLPADCRNWVASINSLMAVPVRGRLLADCLSPIVGTLLETHPRASLLFGLGETASSAVRTYKKVLTAQQGIATLWDLWARRFQIDRAAAPQTDGALDALVCATVAHQFHHAPHTLLRLRHPVSEKTGRGPFYVLAPALLALADEGEESTAAPIHAKSN